MSEHVLSVDWFTRDPGGTTTYVLPCRCETDRYDNACGGQRVACVCALSTAEAGQPSPS